MDNILSWGVLDCPNFGCFVSSRCQYSHCIATRNSIKVSMNWHKIQEIEHTPDLLIDKINCCLIKSTFVLYIQSRKKKTKQPEEFLKQNTFENGLGTQTKIWRCNECNKIFSRKNALDRHNQHHTGKYSHFCSICRKGYNNGYNFKLHVRGHEGKGYLCDYCGKVFKTIQSKQYHESEHSGVYRFACAKCSKGFNYKSKYEQHLSDCQVQTKWLFKNMFSFCYFIVGYEIVCSCHILMHTRTCEAVFELFPNGVLILESL